MGYTVREQWHRHYADGRGFRPLGDVERALLAAHAPAPEHGGRAPVDRRDIALDEDEITRLSAGWARTTRREAEGLAVLVLRHPRSTAAAGQRP